jgi:tetratricopeptide (TPR) repeat protein
VQSNAKQYDAAVKTLRRALELDPNFAQAQCNLRSLYAAVRDKRAALALHSTLKRLDAELGKKLFGEIHRDKLFDASKK